MLIFIEPSILSFDSHKIVHSYGTPEKEFEDFKEFINQLEIVLSECKSKELKIAISKEFWETIMVCIPMSVYTGDSRYRIAKELYLIRLPKFIKKVHQYGDHKNIGSFEDEYIQNSKLLDSVIYLYWVDLLLSNTDRYPNIILKSTLLSIFKSSQCKITGKDFTIEYAISFVISELLECRSYVLFQLKNVIQKMPLPKTVPCQGTGTHDSMWGDKIAKLNDIPLPERAMISNLIATKVVISLTFLEFNKKSVAVSEPFIDIINIEENQNSDNLHCEIHGKGSKQNCQKVSIEMVKGIGKMFSTASNNKIDGVFLNQLLNQ